MVESKKKTQLRHIFNANELPILLAFLIFLKNQFKKSPLLINFNDSFSDIILKNSHCKQNTATCQENNNVGYSLSPALSFNSLVLLTGEEKDEPYRIEEA